MLKTDIDEDVDIVNLLSTFSEPEDTNVELDKEPKMNDIEMLKCMRFVITTYLV
jgi:hypothetical protein